MEVKDVHEKILYFSAEKIQNILGNSLISH